MYVMSISILDTGCSNWLIQPVCKTKRNNRSKIDELRRALCSLKRSLGIIAEAMNDVSLNSCSVVPGLRNR